MRYVRGQYPLLSAVGTNWLAHRQHSTLGITGLQTRVEHFVKTEFSLHACIICEIKILCKCTVLQYYSVILEYL
jgi:hypothetical protein